MNKVILTGNLTETPTLRTTYSGKSVTEFTIAVQRNHGGDAADFIKCTAWEKQAELVCKYVGKGDKIGVVGSWRYESYKDVRDNTRYKNYCKVDEIEFLTSKQDRNAGQQETVTASDYDDDDLPFN